MQQLLSFSFSLSNERLSLPRHASNFILSCSFKCSLEMKG